MENIPQIAPRSDEASSTWHDLPVRSSKGFLNYAGIFASVFLVFVVVVVMTTDIRLTSFVELAGLGLSFFVLLFCSYSMYVNCADSGTRAGLSSKAYTDMLADFQKVKAEIVKDGSQARLSEFCAVFIADELLRARAAILAEAGIAYDEYCSLYLGKDKKYIKSLGSKKSNSPLSRSEIRAIIHANRIRPIRLTPDMIFKRGRGVSRRGPLGIRPETRKRIAFSTKFVRTFITSALMAVIALEVTYTPSFAMFATVLLKLLSVITNGFVGYKFGYGNVAVDTVNYMADQVDLMNELKEYVRDHPVGDA